MRGNRFTSCLLLMPLLTVLIITTGGCYPKPLDQPNIFIIDIDTLRYDHLGVNDPSARYSPNIDAWARKGVVFTAAYSSAPWTIPSQNSIMTGTFPSQHGEGSRFHLCEGKVKGLGELLSQNGYTTAAFYEHQLKFFSKGFQTSIALKRKGDFNFSVPLDWIKQHQSEKMFVLVHTMQVHDYMWLEPHTQEPLQKRFPDYKGLWTTIDAEELPQYWEGIYKSDETDLAYHHACYEEEIRYVDGQFKILLDELGKMGLLDKSIIMITSDHGEGFDPKNKRVFHTGRLHDDLVHVPLIWVGPGLPRGMKVEQPVSQVDIAPSILTLSHAQTPDYLMGQSLFEPRDSILSPYIYAPYQVIYNPDKLIFFEETAICINSRGVRFPYHSQQANYWVKTFGIRTGNIKYIYTRAILNYPEADNIPTENVSRDEIYDLTQDPQEFKNIADDKQIKHYFTIMEDYRKTFVACSQGQAREGIDEATMKEMKALGYVK